MRISKSKFLIVICLLYLFKTKKGTAQSNIENIIETNFTIRDFRISQDSILFIKKRDIVFYDRKTNSSKNYFLGGYGLEFIDIPNTNILVSVSNELVENVSSVRFFNKSTKSFDRVYYNKEGKILDFLIIPENKQFVLSLVSNKIVFIDYGEQNKFIKVIEINIDSLSRKIFYQDGFLYFITDSAGIYQYNINSNQKNKIYQDNAEITDFIINKTDVFYASLDGKIKKLNLETQQVLESKINTSFVTTILENKNNIVCGTWDGNIIIINKASMNIINQKPVHSSSVLKLKKLNGTTFFSSSIDQTIKKWDYSKF